MSGPARALDPRWVGRLPTILIALACLPLLAPRIHGAPGLAWSVLAAAVFGAVWVIGALTAARNTGRRLTVALAPGALPALSGLALIYGAWAAMHPPTLEQLVLLGAQLPFAIMLDMGLGWSRRDRFDLDAGPFLIVGGLGVFLWFDDALFVAHFAVVGLAYAVREYSGYPGERHALGAAGLAGAIAAAVLVLGDLHGLARPETVASSPIPGGHLIVLVGGLLISGAQTLPLGLLGGAAVLMGLDGIWRLQTGVGFFVEADLPLAVLAGLVLFVPRGPAFDGGPRRQLVRGALYGLTVCGLCLAFDARAVLGWSAEHTRLAPLLALPIVEVVARLIGPWIGGGAPASPIPGRRRLLAVGVLYLALGAHVHFASERRPQGTVEPWLEACRAEARGGCLRLGRIYEQRCSPGATTPGCVAASALVLPQACEAGVAEACARYGDLLARGSAAIAADGDAASRALDRACELDELAACNRLGLMLWTGQGLKIDTNRADTLFEKACEGGLGESCEHLGSMLDAVAPPGVRQRAVMALERGCDRGRASACATAGEWYIAGKGVPPSVRQGRGLIEQACRQGLQSACERAAAWR